MIKCYTFACLYLIGRVFPMNACVILPFEMKLRPNTLLCGIEGQLFEQNN